MSSSVVPFSSCPQSFPASGSFQNEPALPMRWPKYWSLSFNISPSNEHPGLISFRVDWLDLLAVQGTLKSLLQYHSSKASILWQPRRVELGLGWGLCPWDHRRVGHDLVTKQNKTKWLAHAVVWQKQMQNCKATIKNELKKIKIQHAF